jgi:4-amino-4-deoxy-L-arabinose transferase-like glycosyltransferase
VPPVARLVLVVPIVYILYFHGLDSVGLLGPDEPRYAAVGREMARSGDWITPRLWGEAWFEKPALLYWMIAAAFWGGINEDLAPRVAVALLSVAFLAGYFVLLREQWGSQAAGFSTAILASSAGWVAFSRIGVTDLPLAAALNLSMLLSLEWLETGKARRLPWAGAMLGVAILAKGLVPLVLSAPLLWMARRRGRHALLFVACALAVAAPWYALCTLDNGTLFLKEFFWRHHFGRFASNELQHVQPFWYYVPVLAGGLLPWTPLTILVRRPAFSGTAGRLLMAMLALGFIFFSASVNKLPGYLLPLLPAACAILGRSVSLTGAVRWPFVASAALIGLTPTVAEVLPMAVVRGLGRAEVGSSLPVSAGLMVALGATAYFLAGRISRAASLCFLLLALTGAVAALARISLPVLDQQASARHAWRNQASQPPSCLDQPSRAHRYQMNYYAGRELPDCPDQ